MCNQPLVKFGGCHYCCFNETRMASKHCFWQHCVCRMYYETWLNETLGWMTDLLATLELQAVIDYGPVVNDPQCGRPVSANRRVLDGQPAGFGSFPWQALIRVGKGKCGGVLVNRRHVVTAGHCVKNKPLSSVVVTLGEYHLKSRREPLPTQSFGVIKAFVHPKFQFSPAADRLRRGCPQAGTASPLRASHRAHLSSRSRPRSFARNSRLRGRMGSPHSGWRHRPTHPTSRAGSQAPQRLAGRQRPRGH